MIGAREALGCVEQIATLEGVDALFIGPYNLALSPGIIQRFDHPKFCDTVDSILRVWKAADVAVVMQSRRIPMLAGVQNTAGST